jgi:hypothetical protein
MKTRTLLSTAVLAIVALALTVPAVGQTLNWQIPLRGDNARNFGSADYSVVKVARKFTVDTTTPTLADGTQLDVYIGPSTNPNEPYGKLVGTIDVDGGLGAMILIAARAPKVHDGTTVSIVEHLQTIRGDLLMKGTF